MGATQAKVETKLDQGVGQVLFITKARTPDDVRSGRCTFYVSESCLPNYKIGEILDECLTSVTYRGTHLATNMPVAVRFYPLIQQDESTDSLYLRQRTDLCMLTGAADFKQMAFIFEELSKSDVSMPVKEIVYCDVAWTVSEQKQIKIVMGAVVTDMWNLDLEQYIRTSPSDALTNGDMIMNLTTSLLQRLQQGPLNLPGPRVTPWYARPSYPLPYTGLGNLKLTLNNTNQVIAIHFGDFREVGAKKSDFITTQNTFATTTLQLVDNSLKSISTTGTISQLPSTLITPASSPNVSPA